MKSLLFVCLGNICRSPIADGIAKKLSLKHNLKLHIDSAGTASWHNGNPPCENSIKVANINGVDISSLRSRVVEKEDKTRFDYVIVMDKNNYQDLRKMGFENLYKMGDYGGFEGACVPDPYHFTKFEGFNKVYDMLDTCVNDFLKTEGFIK